MIGKPQWFSRRKYTGWGFTPSTWQGWTYLAIFVAPLVIVQSIHGINETFKLIFIVTWAFVFILDAIDIMIHLKKDERDILHEAIAERNALWIILAVLVIGIGYQTAMGITSGVLKIDPVILVALFAGVIAKAVTNFHLENKN